MLISLMLVLAPLTAENEQDNRLGGILARVSEEAEVFARLAPRVVGQETLRQRVRKPPPRFRLRVGRAALDPPPIRYQTREIVSEYGYSTFKDAPQALREFRQVVSVEGRPVRDVEKARETLTMGVTSESDRRKKRMLEDFERHGLVGAVSDFGQLILMFRKRQLAYYEFEITGSGLVGADRALVVSYRQLGGGDVVTIFRGREAVRLHYSGELWVRQSDFVPLRITMGTQLADGDRTIRHEATVEYARSSHGVLLPAAVRYHKLVDGELAAENLFAYGPFRMFTVETEVKFTPVEVLPD